MTWHCAYLAQSQSAVFSDEKNVKLIHLWLLSVFHTKVVGLLNTLRITKNHHKCIIRSAYRDCQNFNGIYRVRLQKSPTVNTTIAGVINPPMTN